MFDKRIYLVILSVLLIYLTKPNLIYQPDGKLRQYGVGYSTHGYKKTLFTLPIVIILIVIFIKEFT
jgi:hypothetical protein